MNDTRSKILKKKKQPKRYCENLFTKSPDKFRNIGNLDDGNRRLTRGMLRKLDKQNALFSLKRKYPSRNSVIILNDSDNETSEEDKQDASLSIIECSPTRLPLPSSPQQKTEKKELRKSPRQNNNRSSITLSNLSMKQSSNTQSPCNGENIAPSEAEDDVIELWSSLKNSNKKIRYCNAETNEKLNFVIDTKPDMKNLEYLKTDTKPVRKRRKLCRNFDKLTSLSNKNIKNTSNDSNSSQSNPQSCEEETKTIVSDEKNSPDTNHKLREIVVDGCNVGMAHANHQMFSVKGIQLVIDYFTIRGHVVKVFLPNYLRKYTLLEELYKKGIVVFTPSRNIKGRKITPYDDRFILEYATARGGIVITSDQYRDLYEEKPEWRDTILNRLLTPTFVGDYIMFPEDPLGKSGPNLETFLRH
ncbi:Zinc finger CCCH domain-containing protein 12C [Camponotus floridanus]|uniref:Zinc finger CCCH domain-containing protein 12C n=1 Tax=Camponotus floridanus TaxID=104421 RepID=E1ZVC4_CAMFO|nr:endoribonuclease rege-1 [Camponotus floridanus]EFN74834.1 Zinc finger CCCH domain-containing protein 12C [Camponotus floridanus]